MTLYHCPDLAAKLPDAQCHRNREAAKFDFEPCKGCPGAIARGLKAEKVTSVEVTEERRRELGSALAPRINPKPVKKRRGRPRKDQAREET